MVVGSIIGVTLMVKDLIQLALNKKKDIRFTCTRPRCYRKADACNVHFKAHAHYSTNPNVAPETNVTLETYINDVDRLENPGICILAKTGHGGWQTIETVNSGRHQDTGVNYFTFFNSSPINSNLYITIENVQIVRIYAMCCLDCDSNYLCTNTTECSDEDLPEPCQTENATNHSQDFDTQPIDFACNYKIGGS